MENRFQIAILYICTGKYVAFWEDFYRSCEEHFLKQSKVEYFVFTDASQLYAEKDNLRIHRIHQENLGWPGNTLFRFRMFDSIREQLQSYDYIFFMNANSVIAADITEEEFLPSQEELLVVQHPGFFDQSVRKFPYERRKESSACIPKGQGQVYVYGAVNGGKADAFLGMAHELQDEIQKDYEKGMIAKWHDESHLNYYVWKHGNYKLLTPAYAYPEIYNLPFEKKIILIEKNRKIELDKAKIEELDQRSIRRRMKKLFSRIRSL